LLSWFFEVLVVTDSDEGKQSKASMEAISKVMETKTVEMKILTVKTVNTEEM